MAAAKSPLAGAPSSASPLRPQMMDASSSDSPFSISGGVSAAVKAGLDELDGVFFCI